MNAGQDQRYVERKLKVEKRTDVQFTLVIELLSSTR